MIFSAIRINIILGIKEIELNHYFHLISCYFLLGYVFTFLPIKLLPCIKRQLLEISLYRLR